MKIKTTRICANKGCNKEFKMYKTTDKYCSFSCANLNQKEKPKKTQKPIRQMSEKRKRESYIYARKRKAFLLLPENKYCPVAKKIFNETIEAVEIHHLKGRVGRLLNYVPYWLAVCRKGHNWIHNNPEDAYKLGFLIRSTSIVL